MEAASQPTVNLYTTDAVNLTAGLSNGNDSSDPSTPLFIPCDNPLNVISPSVTKMVDLVVYAGIFPVLVTCGVTTNVINMVVFARQGLSDRIHLCLFSLAVSDTGFLLFLMCGKLYTIISLLDPVAGNYWQQRQNGTVLGGFMACLSISNAITALIAVERCLCIVSPLKAAKFFKTKYMRVVIIVLAVYILVTMNVSFGLKYQTVQITDPVTNTSTYISRLGPVYLRHRTLFEILYSQMLSVTLPFTSFATVIVCTIAVVQRLKVMANWRRQTVSNMTSVEKQEVLVTRMLVTVCCVYLVCMVPNVTRSLVILIRLPGFLLTGYYCNAFKLTIALTHVLEIVNSSVNFFIYLKQSSRYRATLRRLCGCLVTQEGTQRDSSHAKGMHQ